MTPEKLIAIAAAVLSLLFSYLPVIKNWYDNKSPVEKRQIMAGWLLVVTLAIFGISCVPALADLAVKFGILVACTSQSAIELVYMFIIAVATNQTVFLLTPKNKPIPVPGDVGE